MIPTIPDILQVYPMGQRNRIVFCKERIADLDYIDLGREMSLILGASANPENVSGKETVHRQVMNKIATNPILGNYLAIDNIGILFEPALHLNLPMIFDSYSRNNWLVVRTDAEVANGKLHFLADSDPYTINLSNLSFKVIRRKEEG